MNMFPSEGPIFPDEVNTDPRNTAQAEVNDYSSPAADLFRHMYSDEGSGLPATDDLGATATPRQYSWHSTEVPSSAYGDYCYSFTGPSHQYGDYGNHVTASFNDGSIPGANTSSHTHSTTNMAMFDNGLSLQMPGSASQGMFNEGAGFQAPGSASQGMFDNGLGLYAPGSSNQGMFIESGGLQAPCSVTDMGHPSAAEKTVKRRKTKMHQLGPQEDPELEKRRQLAIKEFNKREKAFKHQRNLSRHLETMNEQVSNLKCQKNKLEQNVCVLNHEIQRHSLASQQHQSSGGIWQPSSSMDVYKM